MDSSSSQAMPAVAAAAGLPGQKAEYSAWGLPLELVWFPALGQAAYWSARAASLPVAAAVGWSLAAAVPWKDSPGSSAVRIVMARSTGRQSIRYSGFS